MKLNNSIHGEFNVTFEVRDPLARTLDYITTVLIIFINTNLMNEIASVR